MLHVCHTVPSLLFYSKSLFQQYLVDIWAFYDQNSCDWVQSYQRKLCADLSNGLADALVRTDIKLLNPAD